MSRSSVPSRQMAPQPKHQIYETKNGRVPVDTNVLVRHGAENIRKSGHPSVWLENIDEGINPIGNARRLANVENWEIEKETNNNIQRVKTVYRQAIRKMYSHLNIDYKEIEKSILYENVDADTIVLNLMGAIRHKYSQENIVMEEENDDMSVSNTTITELSGSLYTPSTTSSSEYMDVDDYESDESSYEPRRDARVMARSHGYDDETSSFGSSVMTVEMEDESEYSESEEEMEVGF